MKHPRNIQSLSVFKRDSANFLKQLKETGEPILLTVNGKAAMALFDFDVYENYLRQKEGDPTLKLVPKKGRKLK